MRQVISVSKPKKFPRWKQWKQLPSVLSSFEQRFLQIAFLLLLISIGIPLSVSLFSHRIEIPAQGGEYTEALVGEPQLINPLYATTNDADQDLVALIYSGLMKWDPEQGFITDLADSVEINQEATVYTFVINENARFHNGDPVLARDVLFTINAIQNPTYRSPLLPLFRSVSVVQEDDRKVSFVLEKPQPSFLSFLTVGILPSSAWAEILPQNAPLAALNLQPIGSGPYQFSEFTKDKKGAIRSFSIKSFDQYIHQQPFIDKITFKFYPDAESSVEALASKFVEGTSFVPFNSREEVGQNRAVMLYSPLLSREVALFFNQKTNQQLQKKTIREGIAYAINKKTIANETLLNAGQPIVGPILPGTIGYVAELTDREQDTEKAKTLFSEAGLFPEISTPTDSEEAAEEKKQPNQFTLTTIDSPEFIRVAQTIEKELEAVGLLIEIIPVPADALFDEVIKPRNFELLLTTLMYGADTDPYLFWHSSQTDGIGLNIVDYKNTEIDKLLETAQTTLDDQTRQDAYQSFQEKLLEDIPAIFLYQSSYGYAVTKKVHLNPPLHLRLPSDRFAHIQTWYIKTKKAFK